MVTPREMLVFALECQRWSEDAQNASDRQVMMQVSKMWRDTALHIQHRIELGDELALPDLRNKLN